MWSLSVTMSEQIVNGGEGPHLYMKGGTDPRASAVGERPQQPSQSSSWDLNGRGQEGEEGERRGL